MATISPIIEARMDWRNTSTRDRHIDTALRSLELAIGATATGVARNSLCDAQIYLRKAMSELLGARYAEESDNG